MPARRKREGELQRDRARKGATASPPSIKGELRPVTIPRVDPNWHPIAKRFFKSLKTSGQADFFQDSDWAFAIMLCDTISYYQSGARRSSQMFTAILQGTNRLLSTEADRLQAHIELSAPVAEEEIPSSVIAIDSYKKTLGA